MAVLAVVPIDYETLVLVVEVTLLLTFFAIIFALGFGLGVFVTKRKIKKL